MLLCIELDRASLGCFNISLTHPSFIQLMAINLRPNFSLTHSRELKTNTKSLFQSSFRGLKCFDALKTAKIIAALVSRFFNKLMLVARLSIRLINYISNLMRIESAIWVMKAGALETQLIFERTSFLLWVVLSISSDSFIFALIGVEIRKGGDGEQNSCHVWERLQILWLWWRLLRNIFNSFRSEICLKTHKS